MSKLNLLVYINAYRDKVPTNNPTKSHFKWTLDSQGSEINEPESRQVDIQPGDSLSLFSQVSSLSDDGTTEYSIALKQGTSNTYKITHTNGTAPNFRQARATGADATTEITVTKNGPLIKLESTNGTALDLVAGGVQVGDIVRIGDGFNPVNQGEYKILSLDATSFQIKNIVGNAEGPIVLGAGFADSLKIYSDSGVQVGEKLTINSGFSSASNGTYEITDVTSDYIEIYSLNALPEEENIQTQLNIYSGSKSFLYIESDRNISVSIDGNSAGSVEPITCGTKLKKGIFLKTGNCFSAEIKNESQEVASVFFAIGE